MTTWSKSVTLLLLFFFLPYPCTVFLYFFSFHLSSILLPSPIGVTRSASIGLWVAVSYFIHFFHSKLFSFIFSSSWFFLLHLLLPSLYVYRVIKLCMCMYVWFVASIELFYLVVALIKWPREIDVRKKKFFFSFIKLDKLLCTQDLDYWLLVLLLQTKMKVHFVIGKSVEYE